MKKIFTLLFLFIGASFTASAQNWVETTAQNKKVVLEEFTGIHCVFCPDGHKKAKELQDANKGNVFLVNIHSGGYATPAAGELDMRTTEGDAIDDASGLTGYPAASINRYRTPRVEPGARSTWAASANGQLAESSPVNAYVKSYFDRTNRELTTEVEVYYTANSATTTNKLTVMLTQDNILGTQTGGETYNPDNYIGDQYIHNHVLRQMISTGGAWGEVIDTTTMGHYVYKKYVTTLPEDIKGIPVTFFNLNVVAFVTEGDNNNVLTGYESAVDFDPTGAVDLSIENKTVTGTGLCVDPVAPSVEVTNTSTETVTSFDVTMDLNGTKYTKSYAGSLAPAAKTTITFDETIEPRGEYSVAINGFKNINEGAFFDTDISNDAVNISGLGFQKKAFDYTKIGFNGGMDLNAGRLVDKNTNYSIVTSGGHTGGAVRYAIHTSWNLAGLPGEVVVGEADFTNATDPQVSYYYAYSDGGQGGSAPEIAVKISEDCGVTFTEVSKITCNSTGEPANPANFYVPTSGEYMKQTIDLSAYAGKTIMVSVSGIPGSSGNALYIDEIELGSAAKIATTNAPSIEGLSIYPNPANKTVNINMTEATNAKVLVTDLQGKIVMTQDILNGAGSLNTSNLPNGIYMIKVSNGFAVSNHKVTVAH
jgi:hypothetical protein